MNIQSLKSKKLVKSSIFGQIYFFISIFIALFMTPFMITVLGDHRYGLWMLVASFTGMYGILDLGLTTAVQRYLSKALGTENYEEANIVFNTALIVFSLIGIVCFLSVFILVYFASIFIHDANDLVLFKGIILIIGARLTLSFPMRAFWAIFPCHLRWDINILIDTGVLLIKTFLMIIFLNNGYGIWAVAIINVVADIFGYILNIFLSLKIATYIRVSLRYFDKQRIKAFFNYSVFSFISRITDTVKFSIDNFVISAFLDLSNVTIYSITVRLSSYFIQIVAKSTGFMMPIFSMYEAKNDYDSIRKHFLFVTKISGVVSILIGSMLIIFGYDFILLWLGEKYIESYKLLLILVIPLIIALMQLPSSQLLYGISKHKILSILNVIEVVCNVVLSIILVKLIGLRGVALGTAIPLLIIRLFVLPVYTCRVIDISVLDYFRKTFVPVLLKCTIVILMIWVLINKVRITNYVVLMICGLFYLIVYGFIIFFISFSTKEQDSILNAFPNKISNILKRGKICLTKDIRL